MPPLTLERLRSDIAANPDWARRCSFPEASLPLSPAELASRSLTAAHAELVRARSGGIVECRDSPAVALDRLAADVLAVRGFDHYSALGVEPAPGQACQDQAAFLRTEDYIIGVVSDGVGAAPLSHYGAHLLTDLAIRAGVELLRGCDTLLDPRFHAEYYQRLYLGCYYYAEQLHMHPADACRLFLPATLQVAFITPRETLIVGLADGYVQAGGKLCSVLNRVSRPAILREENIPPVVATALAGDYDHQEIRQWLLAAVGTRGVDARAVERFTGYYQEATGLKIMLAQPTAATAEHGLCMTSDGADYSDAGNRSGSGGVMFPLSELRDVPDAEDAREAACLWNVAADTAGRGIHRLHLVHSMLTEQKNPALEEVSRRALVEGELGCVLDGMSLRDVLEFACFEYQYASATLDPELERLDKALKLEARARLVSILGKSAPTPETCLLPLHDDFAQFRVRPR